MTKAVKGPRAPSGVFLPQTDTFDEYVCKMPSGCWEWSGYRNYDGYGKYRQKSAHRVSFERFKGPIPEGMHVCHSCDNPPCVNPDHLWLGTREDNMRDRDQKNRINRWNGRRRGAANPCAKLTAEQVEEIRSLRGQATQAEIGKRFGVCRNTIYHIYAGRCWANG